MVIGYLGSIAAAAVCIVPGCGVIQAILVAKLLGVPDHLLLYTIICSLITNSLSESISPRLCGNAYTNSKSEISLLECDPIHLTRCIIDNKLVALGVGCFIGLFAQQWLGNLGLWFSLGLLIVLVSIGASKTSIKSSLIWIGYCGSLFILLNLINVSNIPAYIGIIIFTLPFALTHRSCYRQIENTNRIKPVLIANYTALFVGGMIGQVTAGISPASIVSKFDPKSITNFITTSSIDALIEGLGLTLMALNMTSTKSLTGAYVGIASWWDVIICIVLAIVTRHIMIVLLGWLENNRGIINLIKAGEDRIALIVAVITLIKLTAIDSNILTTIGVIIISVLAVKVHLALRDKNLVEPESYGFTFISGMITG